MDRVLQFLSLRMHNTTKNGFWVLLAGISFLGVLGIFIYLCTNIKWTIIKEELEWVQYF